MKSVTVDFRIKEDTIKPLHGINDGVRNRSFEYNTGALTQELGVPYYDAGISTWYNGLFQPKAKTEENNFDILKAFYTFCAFGELYKLQNSVSVSSDEGIYACAAKNEDESAVLLVNFSDEEKESMTLISGLSDKEKEVNTYLIDETHDLEMIKSETISDERFPLYNTLKPYHVIFIKIQNVVS